MSTRSLRRGSLLAAVLLGAATAAPAQMASGAGDFAFETYQLDNGLTVLLAPDPSMPAVAVDVWYDVGARNEQPGLTGFAHLFEHMMFEGSENVADGEHMQLLQRAGSNNFNGTTSEDRTNYYEVVPPNRVNLALWLEADRMRSLAVTEQNLATQQEVVKEEKRMRVDNAPYFGALRRMIGEGTYDPETCFAYAHPSIGVMEDLDAARLEDVQAFFDLYYAPNNATIAIAGDFDPEVVRGLIEEYFGDIPPAAEPPEVECTEPFSRLPLRETIVDPNATLPAYFATYGLVDANHPDRYPLEILASILAGGESSRLHQRLVKEERAAANLFSFPLIRRDPGVLLIGAIANQGVELERIEELLDEELAKVHEEGVTAEELERAKNQLRAQRVRSLQTAIGRAEALQEANLFRGDPAVIRDDIERYMAVTADDVRRVAREYLIPDNRAVALVQAGAGQ